MVIILIHNFQNKKSSKVIKRYLAEINVLYDLNQTVYRLMIPRQMQRETV